MILWTFIFSLSSYITGNITMIDTSLYKESITSGNAVLHYLVWEPRIKSAKNKAIILLHGVGSNEQDLFGLADQLPDNDSRSVNIV